MQTYADALLSPWNAQGSEIRGDPVGGPGGGTTRGPKKGRESRRGAK